MIGVPHVPVAVWGLNGVDNQPDGIRNASGEVVLDVDMTADAKDPRSHEEVRLAA